MPVFKSRRSGIDLRTIGTYELICESADAEPGEICAECACVGPNNKLFTYSTRRGRRIREHDDGKFCSRECHDRFYGLKQREL